LIINELLQWAVLAFMGVFLFGLTRQLGNFLVTGRDRAAVEAGPETGRSLPKELLAPELRRRLTALMQERGHDHGVLVVVGEECGACKGLLESIAAEAAADRVPIVALAQSAGEEYRRQLEAVADIVVVDAPALEKANLVVTPFALIVDEDMKIAHKQLAWKLREVLVAFDEQRADGRSSLRPAEQAAAPELEVVQMAGGTR
jgi:hypothetical protein